ncbi:MAG: gp436 family protein [Rhodoferax sp.]
MMYATVADMVARFGEVELTQLTDAEGAGTFDAAAVARALEDACVYADSHIGLVYQLPLRGCAKPITSPGAAPEYVAPPMLTRMVCDLARYYLMPDLDDKHAAAVRAAAAMRDLQAIAKGGMQLACPWGGVGGVVLQADPVGDLQVSHSFAGRQISDDSLRGFA